VKRTFTVSLFDWRTQATNRPEREIPKKERKTKKKTEGFAGHIRKGKPIFSDRRPRSWATDGGIGKKAAEKGGQERTKGTVKKERG